MKKIIYIDMDSVLCDFLGHARELGATPDEAKHVNGFFRGIKPIPGAVEAFGKLSSMFDVYILTTAPWSNPSAWADKLHWVREHLPDVAYKRLIISHHKQLCAGDYLIDDSRRNGAGSFKGELIQFGTERYPDWATVLAFFEAEARHELEEYLDSRTYYAEGTIHDLIASIAKIDLLSPEEETEAIRKAREWDRQALEGLIAANMRHCVSVSAQYQHRGHDLMQLIKTAERSIPRSVLSFDPAKGVSFARHAAHGMRVTILSELGIDQEAPYPDADQTI